MNMTILPWLTEHTPAGSSTRNLLHFLQSVGTDRLQAYDFGRSGNQEKYGQDIPPEYRVDLVKVPVATYWGQNDWVCSKQVLSCTYMQGKAKARLREVALTARGEAGFTQPSLRIFLHVCTWILYMEI